MKRSKLFAFAAILTGLSVLVWSCGKDDEFPAPQVSSNPTSMNLTPSGSATAEITVTAPGTFKSLTASADKGTATLTDVAGTATTSGTAKLTYVAPSEVGSYTITLTVTDDQDKTGTKTITVSVTAKEAVNVPAGNVDGTWETGTTYIAGGTLIIPAGKTLTIPAGVTVIFDGDGSQGAPELSVQGNLYVNGTKEQPVTFTIPEAKRVKDNIFAGLWGGLQATTESGDLLLQYAVIEYVGAPTGATNPSVNIGPYEDGDPRYGILYSNPSGKFVMQNSTIRYTTDDAMRVVGGTILLTNNWYILNGKNGGEAVNIKSSVTGTVAFNMAYRAATNAWKWSNKSGTAATPQTDMFVYNNTSVECGWRQTKTGRGGSVNVEAGGRGKCYNNLIVNCRFGAKIVDDADVTNIAIGYNQYYGTDKVMTDEFYPTAVTFKAGDSETGKDVKGDAGSNDPKFVAYTVSSYTSEYPVDPLSLDYMPATADFHLQSGAPGLNKGKTGFTASTSITINGTSYSAPAPANYIGAFGTN